MRVLHVIQAVAPRYGGPSTTIGPLVAALNRLPGVTAELATTDADGPGCRLDPTDAPAGIPIHLFRRTATESWKYSAGLGRWLQANAGRFDIIHSHGLWSYCNMAAATAARRMRVPYVVRPAGMLSEYCMNTKAAKKRVYWAAIEGRSVRGAAGFHATGEDEVADIRRVRPDARTFLIPQGVETAAFDVPAEPGWLPGLCGPAVAGRPILLFVGRLHPVKGLTDFLLPAMARLPGLFLAVAGGADAQAARYPEEVRSLIGRLGLADRVALLGAVPPADRWRLFDGAVAFVLPSHSENFGMVVVEAMARACPVVVTDGVQAKAHVREAGAGRVVQPDVVALADALAAVAGDMSARRLMGAAGAEYVRRHLTWDGVAGQVAEMYDVVITAGVAE